MIYKGMIELYPQGGWSCGETYDSIIMDKGLVKPTEKEVNKAIAKVSVEEPIFSELSELDVYLPRYAESYHLNNPERDPFLNAKALRKVELRSKLKEL